MTDYHETPQGRRLAYMSNTAREGIPGPGIVFLGGFKSDMHGSKAEHLAQWAQAQGRPFLRFDYSGHGASSGRFEDGAIGDWAQDAAEIIGALTRGPQLLVGSSMGGWIALLLCCRMPERIAGMVGIAAAPDFTEDSMWASFDPAQRAAIERDGRLELPSDYGEPYVITRRLIEEGRGNLVLRDPLAIPGPLRLLQGTGDREVPVSVATRLLEHADCADARLTLVRGADHRFSDPDCLSLIEAAIGEVIERT
ncbi:alpha/beta hydrolase [Profundibacterium mesophilum]|uniref:2-succinyl-6-hydroxy-2 4-cyclohexadiene-1-carboxylate synthase n=1 Tax=Profundibacterium mesophilum KAUST100406-0324 TaxID=1037889 RepID=A0A921TDM9_9RHOB|nr:alpha/beta hydrolase [Profundibacterium mesophilum]KAF0676993.1 2-succinyl-6-hydroxy-2 4-cyclohexadiene-1-carboxylate synthase [Profundibacterium mesophilum KAUST100406-0324]